VFKLKYPVDPSMAGAPPITNAPHSQFDLERLNPKTFLGRATQAIARSLSGPILGLLREFAPRLRIGRLLILTRHSDVVAVLNDDRAFAVPFNPEMSRLAQGATFMLGLDGGAHACQRTPVEALLGADRAADLTSFASEVAKALLSNSGGRIDVIRDYFARISTECVCRLLGMEPDDPDRFGDWTIPLSALLFGDPFGNPVIAELADHGAWRLRGVADNAIAQAREAARYSDIQQPLSLLADLLQPDGRAWTEAEMRALMMGIATGATPTMTLLAGNIFQWLLARPTRMREAIEAAGEAPVLAGRSRLLKILLEASRFAPALDPGQFRVAREGARLPGSSDPIPADTVILAATASALKDRRIYARPDAFDPDRAQPEEHLAFGAAPHRCLGQEIAERQLDAMFRELLRQPGLRRAAGRAGRMHRVGPFPARLDVEFDIPGRPRGQAMVTILLPAPHAQGARREEIESEVRALDAGRWQDALEATGIVHFASLSLIDCRRNAKPEPRLLLELSSDGDWPDCLRAVEEEASDLLEPLLRLAGTPVGRFGLARHLSRHRLRVHRWPWGSTGLNFNGQSLFSVHAKIEARAVANFATRAIDLYLRVNPSVQAGRPMDAIRFVRGLMVDPYRLSPRLARPVFKDRKIEELAREAASIKGSLWRPGRHTLPWVDWVAPDRLSVLSRFLHSPDALPIWIALAIVAMGIGAVAMLALAPLGGMASGWVGPLMLVLTSAIVLTLVVAGLALWRFWTTLRQLEDRDWPDGRSPSLPWVKRVAGSEDRPGHLQNHFISVSRLKAGPVRRLTLALAMWGIEKLLAHGFPPGFASDIGTIHTARWVRLPGSRELLFTANYDGSWESYLEDFIMLAHEGQTAAWSNAEGFPPTRGLSGRGASDGDRFKRWVRLQQQPTGAWYTRFPRLSMDRIRRDAEIVQGLAQAATDVEARRWLTLFGSRPPKRDMLDLEDVQTVVLSGARKLTHGACFLVRLPAEVMARRQLLEALRVGSGLLPPIAFGMPAIDAGLVRPPAPTAWIAFSARGLSRIGLTEEAYATFDIPFQTGMRKRAGLLGLRDCKWIWNDKTVDFAYTILATEDDLLAARQAALEHFSAHGARIERVVELAPVQGSVDREPFGFRDGISQPVLKDVRSDLARASPNDVVAPGELLFGHPGNDGHVNTPPRVQAERDPLGLLPDAASTVAGVFPAFRDLGRNGCMVALQQFEQDVPGFQQFCGQVAHRLLSDYPALARATVVSDEWVAAKFVGRWRDGSPLVERPTRVATKRSDAGASNGFGYATEDPMGLRCPLGAHIRRANPRDALEPMGPRSLARSNRHRILRRGRAWRDPAGRSRGLLFVGLCTSLERQFEFIQRGWLSSENFNTLDGEADPIMGPHSHPDARVSEQGLTGVFTIPTDKGPLRVEGMRSFVTLLGGGYFFLPGRAGFDYLLWLAEAQARRREKNGLPGDVSRQAAL
jgi:cytochrome P450/deferrochelatase/peroxidase EfeB